MLKKLRRRFVTISMSIICSVLVFFYLFSGAVFFVSITMDMRSVLETFSESSALTGIPEIGGKNTDDSIFALHSGNVCVVEVQDLGSIAILDFSRANMDEAILSRAVSYVLQSGYSFGHINELNLFYNKTDIKFGSRIAFSDSTQYFSYLETILFDGAILIFLSSLFLWGIMRFLAKMSLKPVEKAWMQQKNFIADASHELKTPLTVILTNSGILKSHPEASVGQQIQWVDSTFEEATHMKELVDKLLLLAKTDDMNQKNMFTDVNLSDLTMQLALQYEPVAFEKGIMLYSDIDKDIHIDGDRVALNQIIHILLDNAIKYSDPEGEVTLSLKKRHTYSFRKDTGYVYLSTRNTGTPIPQEDIPHLFERFYRSDKARTAGGGYGLGLSICKNLAQLHNADISVTSDVENGTVFTVKFKI
ncbi:MAG: HAMP domain-containing histidine kinase [Clostridia bacterium]|nr:HAMP domain-containing histidine kinase [Clostridia bacterium]